MTELTSQRREEILASFARQTMMTTFGGRIEDLAPGSCTISAPILPMARQQHGVGHAGLTFTLGDTAAGYAAATLIPEGQDVMTAEIKINLLRPAEGAADRDRPRRQTGPQAGRGDIRGLGRG